MKNKLTHEQLLEETGKCNKLGAKCVDMSNRLRLLEAYWGVSNGGDVYGMLDQLDRIIKDLQAIRDKPFEK
jgi:hypothetical protein